MGTGTPHVISGWNRAAGRILLTLSPGRGNCGPRARRPPAIAIARLDREVHRDPRRRGRRTSNIEHRTSNIEHRTSDRRWGACCQSVGRDVHGRAGRVPVQHAVLRPEESVSILGTGVDQADGTALAGAEKPKPKGGGCAENERIQMAESEGAGGGHAGARARASPCGADGQD